MSATVGDVSLMLVAVPLPVDGTVELRAEEPMELDKLEILFKAQVDVEGAPGQLTKATVRVSPGAGGESLTLVATVEDAETGETRSVEVRTAVQVPTQAPESGGPRPRPADESELDWDDDDTFEAMFKDPLTQEDPLPQARRGGDDFDDDGPDTETRVKQERGFGRLLKALLADDPSDAASVTADPPAPEPDLDDEAADDDDEDESIDKLLRLVMGGGAESAAPEGAPDMVEDPGDVRGLLGFLLEREQLELEPGYDVEGLVPGAAPIMASPKGPEARAKALSEWLFDQDAVGELYIDDDSLATLISQW